MSTPDQRRARRAWISEHHPDRGGDPESFASGLAALDGTPETPTAPRATVVRSRRPGRLLRRLARRVTKARRRRTHHGLI